MPNLFQNIPTELPSEILEEIISSASLRIERILSDGHTTPDTEWYDQEQNEWVLVLQGSGTLEFDDGEQTTLNTGDYLNITAHRRHRVVHTDKQTIWLAVHYS